MEETLDFASLMIKLVVVLAIALMAAVSVVEPEQAISMAPGMFIMVAPLFLLAILLDLAGQVRRR